MLLTSLFQNQILDNLFLGNSEINFVLHVNLISCYFFIFYSRFYDWKFSLEEKMPLTDNLWSMSLVLKASFNR